MRGRAAGGAIAVFQGKVDHQAGLNPTHSHSRAFLFPASIVKDAHAQVKIVQQLELNRPLPQKSPVELAVVVGADVEDKADHILVDVLASQKSPRLLRPFPQGVYENHAHGELVVEGVHHSEVDLRIAPSGIGMVFGHPSVVDSQRRFLARRVGKGGHQVLFFDGGNGLPGVTKSTFERAFGVGGHHGQLLAPVGDGYCKRSVCRFLCSAAGLPARFLEIKTSILKKGQGCGVEDGRLAHQHRGHSRPPRGLEPRCFKGRGAGVYRPQAKRGQKDARAERMGYIGDRVHCEVIIVKIAKAVIPVAGKGTRFLPASKQIPKELIPIINVPMLAYPVCEAVQAGVQQIIFVNSCGKSGIEDYFDRNLELEAFLRQRGKHELAEKMSAIGEMIEIISVRQKRPLGLGHAIKCARAVVGQENFAVLLGDDLIRSERPAIGQLMQVSAQREGGAVVGVMRVEPSETHRYGIVSGRFLEDDPKTLILQKMVEKPPPDKAPSPPLATPGRYILTPGIFDALDAIAPGAGGEYQLTDAIDLLAQKETVFAHLFEGERFDTGSLPGYLDATVDFALGDSETRPLMERIIREKIKKYQLEL